MTWWWVGNAVFVLVVIPVVVVLLYGLFRPVISVKKAIDRLDDNLASTVGGLDDTVTELGGTRRAAGLLAEGLHRYLNAVDRIL